MSRLRRVLKLALGALALAAAVHAHGAAAPAPKSDPKWSDLRPAQQKVLEPLKDDWANMDAVRKRKWVVVANRYAQMKPEEQARVQRRMKAWAALTPEQRQAARSNFQTVRELPSDQKQQIREKWKQYQGLPEEQRRAYLKPAAKPVAAPPLAQEVPRSADSEPASGAGTLPPAEPAQQ